MEISPVSPSYPVGHFLLRAAIASAFLYPPIAALADPIGWSGYFPAFIRGLPLDGDLVLHAFGVAEIVLSLWLISGRAVRAAGTVAAAVLFAIVAFNLGDFGILFRDVSLGLAALALVFLPRPHTHHDAA